MTNKTTGKKSLTLEDLRKELDNFEEMAKYLIPTPRETPKVNGFDIYGKNMPLNGIVGGDHIIYIDFKKRYDLERRKKEAKNKFIRQNLEKTSKKVAMVIADVSGHNITDYLFVSQLHQATMIGLRYELGISGEITTDLFENLNTRFYKSSSLSKYITMIYGELSENGSFRFISAAHPPPVLFSGKDNKIMHINECCFQNSQPLGFMPSKEDIDIKTNSNSVGFKDKYFVNEWVLKNPEDILILYTDGLSEHDDNYFSKDLENRLQQSKHLSSEKIYDEIKNDLFKIKKPEDDISYIIIKKE
ncbi:MAG: PP2C family protein-serine/threonine phosphatase [archaeon]